jgi:hypothetical protein
MKLTTKTLKDMILEAVNEATAKSLADRINAPDYGGREDRQAEEFVVMSADRGEKTPAENRQRYQELKSSAKAAGFPFTELQGKWEETDEETDEKREVIENSLIIYSDERPDIPRSEDASLFDFGKQMSAKYDQEAFIFGELLASRSGNKVRTIQAFDAAGAVQNWGGPWKSVSEVEKDSEFWSKVRGGGSGKPFQFTEDLDEEVHPAPNSMMEAMKTSYTAKAKGRRVKFVRGKK